MGYKLRSLIDTQNTHVRQHTMCLGSSRGEIGVSITCLHVCEHICHPPERQQVKKTKQRRLPNMVLNSHRWEDLCPQSTLVTHLSHGQPPSHHRVSLVQLPLPLRHESRNNLGRGGTAGECGHKCLIHTDTNESEKKDIDPTHCTRFHEALGCTTDSDAFIWRKQVVILTSIYA